MEKISVSIEEPCRENWRAFRKTPLGGFCDTCSKEVIDFTKMSDQALVDFLAQPRNHLCGRFKQSQLKTYQVTTTKSRRKWAIAPIILAFTTLIWPVESSAQTKPTTKQFDQPQQPTQLLETGNITFSGKIYGSDGDLLPGANVFLKGTSIGTFTDMNGIFHLTISQKALHDESKLVISFVGFETKEIEISPDVYTTKSF